MKTKLFISTLAVMLALAGCSSPSVEDIEKESAAGVERLLTEDNNEELFLRMDRYFLSEQVDDLTYKGTLKATAFFPKPTWDSRQRQYIDKPDSMKLYRTVIIKFRDKKYDYYTISIKADDE